MATILLTGGGTAGHCTPNIALIPYLKEHFDKIYYIGSEGGIERNLIEKTGIPYFSIPCAKLVRSFNFQNLTIPFKVLSGIQKAKSIIDKIKPDVVFSKGGYVAVPVVIAARKRKIPIISHESDLTVGLANKITAKYCEKVLTSFPETAKNLSNGEYVGSPIRQEIFEKADSKTLFGQFGFSGNKPVILVTGGSQGAKAINDAICDSLFDLLPKYDIIHICGKGNLTKIKRDGYFQTEYLLNVADAFKITSVCVTRAGSNTLFELLSLKVPCVLIPLPKGNSRGDQVLNAQYFQKLGLVTVLPQDALSAKSLTYAVNSTYANRFNIARNFSAHSFDNACPKIIKIILNCLR